MTQYNKRAEMNAHRLVKGKKCLKDEKEKIDVMIRGYQEMAEINLAISRMCFEVEREVEYFYDRLTECE